MARIHHITNAIISVFFLGCQPKRSDQPISVSAFNSERGVNIQLVTSEIDIEKAQIRTSLEKVGKVTNHFISVGDDRVKIAIERNNGELNLVVSGNISVTVLPGDKNCKFIDDGGRRVTQIEPGKAYRVVADK